MHAFPPQLPGQVFNSLYTAEGCKQSLSADPCPFFWMGGVRPILLKTRGPFHTYNYVSTNCARLPRGGAVRGVTPRGKFCNYRVQKNTSPTF